VKGNQGTEYVEESDKHFICKLSTGLQAKFSTESTVLRQLSEEEVFEVKVCNVADGSEGWFTLTSSNMQPWSPLYKCQVVTTLTETVDIKEGKTVRKTEVQEVLEAIDTPAVDKVSGILRVKVRAEKDGAIGFASVRSNQGKVILKPVLG